MSEQPLLYRAEEAAQVLRVSRSRVFELIASGALESIKIGRSRRVSHDALRAYIDRLRSEQGAGLA